MNSFVDFQWSRACKDEPFIRFTPGCRGFEIAEWLVRHAWTDASSVISGDEEGLLLSPVRINPQTGLTAVDVRTAISVGTGIA